MPHTILCPETVLATGASLLEGLWFSFARAVACVTCREPSMRRAVQQIHLKGDGEKKENFFPQAHGLRDVE